MINVSTSTGEMVMANVSSQLSDPGTLLVITILMGIILVFYFMNKIVGISRIEKEDMIINEMNERYEFLRSRGLTHQEALKFATKAEEEAEN